MDHFALDQLIDALRRGSGPRSQQAQYLPLLHRLEREGLLAGRWRSTSHGVRRVYRTVDRGRKARAWQWGRRWLARLTSWSRASADRSRCAERTADR
jgi:DNA-binding PadR family transcriptional regulator